MINSTFPSIIKFTAFVQLKDYRQPTKDEYVRYVRKLAGHFQCDPASLSEDQLRTYFLFLRQEENRLKFYQLFDKRLKVFETIPLLRPENVCFE